MRKFRLLSVFLFLLLFSKNVYAACDTAESNRLSGLAVNVKASYEAVTKEIVPGETFNPPDGMTIDEMENYTVKKTVFNIYISNLTDELFVTVDNKATGESKTYTYQDSDNGTISFEQEDLTTITNYTITVYSSNLTNCYNTKLYTLYLTTPMYNTLSEYDICEGAEDFYLCYEYLAVEPESSADFFKLVEKYKEGKIDADGEEIKEEEEKDKSFFDYLDEHKIIVISVIATVIIGGGIATVIIVKKQRSRIV